MLKNKSQFNGIELAAIFGEQNLYNIENELKTTGTVIDTRILEKGNIFIALKGENLDGHDLIGQAFEKGAAVCIIENEKKDIVLKEFPESSFIFSDDNIEALCKLGKHHRLRFDFPVVAIGGSNGKTTTKEMTASVLSKKFNVLKTYANFNNKIGVPLMLLSFTDDYDMAVLEIGTNTPGEIYDLAKTVNPTHALITNIGKEHLEFLLDLDGVELEETYLFSEVRSDGYAFVNYDDERLKKYGHILGKFTTFGIHEHSQQRFSYILNDNLNPVITVHSPENEFSIEMKTVGYTSALNAIAAATVGIHFEIDTDNIKNALENFKPLESETGYGRMAISDNKGFRIINDTYNANPDSVMAAIKNLEMVNTTGNKYAVLGDMRELGEAASEEHFNIISEAVNIANAVLVIGDEMLKAADKIANEKLMTFNNKTELIKYLETNIKSGDCILVKGSRGMKMEEIVSGLKSL